MNLISYTHSTIHSCPYVPIICMYVCPWSCHARKPPWPHAPIQCFKGKPNENFKIRSNKYFNLKCPALSHFHHAMSSSWLHACHLSLMSPTKSTFFTFSPTYFYKWSFSLVTYLFWGRIYDMWPFSLEIVLFFRQEQWETTVWQTRPLPSLALHVDVSSMELSHMNVPFLLPTQKLWNSMQPGPQRLLV